jgi:bifunctional non-homologous end joining protein LigD
MASIRIDPNTLAGAREDQMPTSIAPEKATLCKRVPEGEDWIFEIKYDGYRLIAFIDSGRVRLVTRRGNDWTARFPEIARELETLDVESAVIDGEVVAMTSQGTTSFQKLQNEMRGGAAGKRLIYYAFDLIYLDGSDLRKVELVSRKRLLSELVGAGGDESIVQYSEHVEVNGERFYEFSCEAGLEGIICKRRTSSYRQKRSDDWRKVKCINRQEFVVGGFTDPSGSRQGFGALLLGTREKEGDLVYCGKVGTGFTAAALKRMHERLTALEREHPAFVNPPSGDDLHWIEPEVVVEVAFREWTVDGHLRHPSFKGVREDKAQVDVRREKPVRAATDDVAGVHLTHPDKVLFPEQDVTKRDLALYYERAGDLILPHITQRPLMILRCPMGHQSNCFHQKHVTSALPDGVRPVVVTEKDSPVEMISIVDLPGLIGLVQLGTLEFHPWGSRSVEPESPDRLILDLDPSPEVEWPEVVGAARELRGVLGALGLDSFVRTTGGKGLHVVVPLIPTHTWGTVKHFAAAVAKEMAQIFPKRFTATMTKQKRVGKIFIDHFRNARGATAVGSYSTRARPGAPVAAPVSWEELSEDSEKNRFTLENMPARFDALDGDPWKGFFAVEQEITKQAQAAMGVTT